MDLARSLLEPPVLRGGPTALPISVPAQRLALRSSCAPRRPLTCPTEDGPASSAGFGCPAWAGERQRSRLVAAVELPGGRLCSRPRVPAAAAAASAPRTAPALCPQPSPAPPGVVPGAWHPGPAPLSPRSPQPGPRRLWADLGDQRGGSPSSPPPAAAAAASLSPPCSVLPSTLGNQPTRRFGPSSRAGRAGAGQGAGGSPEEAAQRRVRGWDGLLWLLEPSTLSQPFSPPCSSAPPRSNARSFGFLKHFWSCWASKP